jgi:hypothetical protein
MQQNQIIEWRRAKVIELLGKGEIINVKEQDAASGQIDYLQRYSIS